MFRNVSKHIVGAASQALFATSAADQRKPDPTAPPPTSRLGAKAPSGLGSERPKGPTPQHNAMAAGLAKWNTELRRAEIHPHGLNLPSSAAPAQPAETASAAQATPNGHFDHNEIAKLQKSERVLILEYSSTGGGHTDRSLLPAAEDGVLKRGDSIVLLAPPRWPHDGHGGHVNKLHQRAGELEKRGINVLIRQTDKTITGMYKPDGSSDNVAMLRDFIYKPQRAPDVNLSAKLPSKEAPWPQGSGAKASAILDDLMVAVGAGATKKIVALGDMAPFMHKAAQQRGIEKRIEIGNHQALFIGAGRQALGDKDLSYLAKASSSGMPNKLALIDYNEELNVLPTLANTFDALKISPSTSTAEARAIVVDHLLDHAQRNSLNVGEKWKPGILVADGADSKSIKGLVYAYVNDYTQQVADFVRQSMKDDPEKWRGTIVALCGPKAFREHASHEPQGKPADNILHVMYAAHADGVTSAGFGTTSEFFYLHKNGYKGKFIVAPVENQHEQGANAAELVERCKGKVQRADGVEQVNAELAKLVAGHAEAAPLSGFMGKIFNAVTKESGEGEPANSNVGHAAELLTNPQSDMRKNAHAAVAAMADYEGTHAPKERRRVYKLIVPALDAMIASGAPDSTARKPDIDGKFTVQPTQTSGPKQVSVEEAIKLMKQASVIGPAGDGALHGLLDIDIKNATVKTLLAEHATALEALMRIESPVERSAQAQKALERLAIEHIALGW